MNEIVFPAIDLRAIGPVLALAVTGLVLLVLDILPPRDRKDHLALIGIAGVLVSLVMTLRLWGSEVRAFRGMVILDSFARLHKVRLEQIPGTVPKLIDPAEGCRFAARCKYAVAECLVATPALREPVPGHKVRCIFDVFPAPAPTVAEVVAA